MKETSLTLHFKTTFGHGVEVYNHLQLKRMQTSQKKPSSQVWYMQ